MICSGCGEPCKKVGGAWWCGCGLPPREEFRRKVQPISQQNIRLANWIQARLKICDQCEHSVPDSTGVCSEYLRRFPDRPGVIRHQRGARRLETRCPLDEWGPGLLVKAPVFEPEEYPSGERCIVTVVVGYQAEEIHELTGPGQRDYAARVGADYLVIRGDRCPWYPIGNKWRVGQVAKNYSRTLFLDVDVWVRINAPDIFAEMGNSVAMHDDTPWLQSRSWLDSEVKAIANSQGIAGEDNPCWNTGVVLCDRAFADIWNLPTKPFPLSHTAEQTLVGLRAKQHGVRPLDSRWNTQWWWKDFAEHEPVAWFVHLAGCPHDERIRLLQQMRQSDGR